jgi:hypothetical protein
MLVEANLLHCQLYESVAHTITYSISYLIISSDLVTGSGIYHTILLVNILEYTSTYKRKGVV